MEQIYNIVVNILAGIITLFGLVFCYGLILFTKELKDEYYQRGWFEEDEDL